MTVELVARTLMLASMWLMMLDLGARESQGSLLYIFGRPGLLVRAFIAMFIVVPAFALLLATTTELDPAIRFVIVAMSAAPIPPVLPHKQIRLGGGVSAIVGLLLAASVAALVA